MLTSDENISVRAKSFAISLKPAMLKIGMPKSKLLEKMILENGRKSQ